MCVGGGGACVGVVMREGGGQRYYSVVNVETMTKNPNSGGGGYF